MEFQALKPLKSAMLESEAADQGLENDAVALDSVVAAVANILTSGDD